jgi:uncharacterized protein YjiS (DUF1127 family)
MNSFKTVLGTIAQRFQTWIERERAYAELSSLDDHTLADLGLRRSDIPFVVYSKEHRIGEDIEVMPVAANSNDGRRAA